MNTVLEVMALIGIWRLQGFHSLGSWGGIGVRCLRCKFQLCPALFLLV
jgi:hypothetical protein